MPSTIYRSNFIVMHTFGCGERNDVAFQKAAWTMDRRQKCLQNLQGFCKQSSINTHDGIAVLGFKQENGAMIRVIEQPDENIFDKIDGNILITTTKVPLVAWASDCCLVAIAADGGEQVAVLHASVKTFATGVIDAAIAALRNRGAKKLEAYIGACAGSCCYEYGADQAKVDFAGHERYIIAGVEAGKVFLDLHGAIKESLQKDCVTVTDIFSNRERCTICAKRNGEFIFPSYRREVVDGKHVNGQYALVISKI